MTEPSLAFQKAIWRRLTAAVEVTQLVPVDDISDRHGLPTVDRCIILGDGQTLRESLAIAGRPSFRCALNVHVWAKATNLVEVKRIGAAVAEALRAEFWGIEGHRVVSLFFEQAQYLRDPSGEWAHGVLTFESVLTEEAA